MKASREFQRWSITPPGLLDLSPPKARELVTRCFLEAQKETFARTRRSVGLTDEEADVERSVRTAVKAVFHEVGADYGWPSREDLQRVVAALSARAAGWGTPDDVVAYHRAQLSLLLAHVPS